MWPFSRRPPPPPSPEELEKGGDLAGLVALLGSEEGLIAQRARAALVRLRAVEALEGAVGRGSTRARGMALRGLAELKPASLAATLSGLLEDPEPELRKLAGQLGGVPRGTPRSAEAVAALARVGVDGVQTALIAADSGDVAIRRAAAGALAALVGSGGVEDALLRLSADADAAVRATATRGLAHVGASSLGRLRALLGDPDAQVQEAAADGLAALGAREAVPDLIERLKAGSWPAARALGALRAAEAVPGLVAALDDARIGGVAATALAEIGDRSALSALQAFVGRTPRGAHAGGEPDDVDLALEAISRLERGG